jgi:hypothetical protein
MRTEKNYLQRQNGSIVVSILIVMIFMTTLVYSLIVYANANVFRARSRIFVLQSQYAAESAADQAIAILNNGNTGYTGTSSDVTLLTVNNLYKATYSVVVNPGADNKEKIITAVGKVYTPASAPTPRYIRTIEVVAQQSSSNGSTAMLSRNIIDIASGVKTIQAVDIHANSYINLVKNTTDLVAENITVGGKNTGAANCSIGGDGNLKKPTSFTHAGQTKTLVKVAYNNCISPPGNVSNADFDVLVNQTDIEKMQSTFIPWGAYMDTSYQNAPGGCNDWTTGSFPRSIPSTGNDKKTHYPDTGSNISNSCGSSGDLYLANGQYNIRNHTHIRANLCAATACTPTFYNPDSGAAGIKFIFVEGTINFDGLLTAPGSGPIVFVTYGSDPSSKAGACPLGGSIFLGNAINTNAPAAFLLATNGLCLYQAKFGAAKALGGLSGKNIYISTNSGTPWDLELDPVFPASSIPVDLSWKAVLYRRL